MDLVLLLISSMIINNIILMQFLGLCSFFGVSTKVKTALGMGAAVIVVIVIATAITYPLYHLVLVKYNIQYIDTIAFILVIASIVQLIELVIKKFSQPLYKALGVYLPLITTNCAVLGVALKVVATPQSFPHALVYALGTAMGFAFMIVIFSTIRVRLETASVPKAFKGLPIAFITTSLMSMAFLGLAGLI